MRRTKIKAIFDDPKVDQEVLVKGWVRTKRGSKNVTFIALNDGSSIHNLQVVADANSFSEDALKDVTTGASLAVKGKLVASQGSGQAVELMLSELEVLGTADPDKFPLQPKRHSL